MGRPVVHFEIVGKDANALQRFYEQAFGWQIGPKMAGVDIHYAMAYPQAGVGIDGGIGGASDGYAGHVTFYIAVPSLEDALGEIERCGGKTMMPPDRVPDGPRIALFADPEGHVVGLLEANQDGDACKADAQR
jgi:predicted enzyme related to lactoylglutathione lyase